MGGGPCRLKQILDQAAAAQRAQECMRNTGLVAAAATTGKATVPPQMAADFQAAAEAYAKACAAVEGELEQYLPPDVP